MANDGLAVVLEDVKKDYRVKGRSTPTRALRGLNMSIKRGSMVAVKGPSGSGKTTLLQIIGALDVPTSGKVEIGGKDLSEMREKDLTEHRAKTVGFVFQTFNLIPNLTALENVELPMEALNRPKKERKTQALKLLEAVGMEDRADYKPLKLSGGEQQRVAIARALANDPSIILADEPTGNLDSNTGAAIVSLMDKLRKERGTTILIVTHSRTAASACDLAFTIKDGIITSQQDVKREAMREERKKSLRTDLALPEGVFDKLFGAGFEDLEAIAGADADKLVAALGDKKKAMRIAKKARVLLQKDTEVRKKILAIDLSVSEEVVTSLFSAGYYNVESIRAASLDELERILGDKKLAVEVSTSAQELM